MFDNKMIEYQRRIARINNKIKILSDNGYNVDNYNLTIQSIIDSCNNNVTTIKQVQKRVGIFMAIIFILVIISLIIILWFFSKSCG